jgi:hypothetical protein
MSSCHEQWDICAPLRHLHDGDGRSDNCFKNAALSITRRGLYRGVLFIIWREEL